MLDGNTFLGGGYSALMPDGRPSTSESGFANRLRDALEFGDASGVDPESPPRSRSPKVMRVLGSGPPIRPSLTSSATDTVFRGEGYATVHPSRTLSYPSPSGRPRRPSDQLSPVSDKSLSERSQQDHRNARSATVTPIKRSGQGSQTRSPAANQESSTPIAAAQAEAGSKPGQSSSLRSKMKMSLTPGQSTHQSVASRIFRRSNSQSTQQPPSAQTTTPTRPRVTRATSSSARHARIPRPTSLYGSTPIYGQRPPPSPSHLHSPRPSHSSNHNLSPNHSRSPTHNYELAPMLPEGMLTEISTSSSSSRHRRERPERRRDESWYSGESSET